MNERQKSMSGLNPPNEMSLVRGIKLGSVVETTQGVQKRFTVEGFDLEGAERGQRCACGTWAHWRTKKESEVMESSCNDSFCGPHPDDMKECEDVSNDQLMRVLRRLFRANVLLDEAAEGVGVSFWYLRRMVTQRKPVRAVLVRALEVLLWRRLDAEADARSRRSRRVPDPMYAVAA